jgi:hypothetical protein
MKTTRTRNLSTLEVCATLALVAAVFCLTPFRAHAADPLPTWNDTAPKQVIGSSIKTKFELRDDKPVIVRLTTNSRGVLSAALAWRSSPAIHCAVLTLLLGIAGNAARTVGGRAPAACIETSPH